MMGAGLVKLSVLAILLVALSGIAKSGTPPVTLEELAKQSQCILLGQVTHIRVKDGVHIAETVVIRALKGAPGPRVYFMGQPAIAGETIEATVGTTYLLFLRSLESSEFPDTAFRYLGVSNLSGFIRKLTEGFGDKLYTITHAGRGQMPVVKEVRTSSVRVRTEDVVLPKQIQTHPDLALQRDAPICRVLLSDMMDYVNEIPVSR